MKFAAVIVTYNRPELLLKCLDAVLRQTRPVDAIVLVDNGSTKETANALQEGGFLCQDLLHYIRLDENIGSAGGFFTGIKYAFEQGYDWLWTMDDDVIPFPTALERLLQHALGKDGAKIGGLVSNQTDWANGAPAFKLPKSVTEAFRYSVSCPLGESGTKTVPVPVDWCSLASFLMPKTVVSQIGYPRTGFFLFCDDIDYTMRIREAGYSLFLVKDSVVDHRSGVEARKAVSDAIALRWYYSYRNHIANIIIHRNELGRALAVSALIRISLGAARRICLSLSRGDYNLSKLLVKGLIHGYLLRLGKYAAEVTSGPNLI